MKKFGSIVVVAFATFGLNAQISSGKVEEPKKEETKVKTPKEKRVPTEGTEELVLFGGMEILWVSAQTKLELMCFHINWVHVTASIIS
jgi:hypothetical protein